MCALQSTRESGERRNNQIPKHPLYSNGRGRMDSTQDDEKKTERTT